MCVEGADMAHLGVLAKARCQHQLSFSITLHLPFSDRLSRQAGVLQSASEFQELRVSEHGHSDL